MPLPPECWNYSGVPLLPAQSVRSVFLRVANCLTLGRQLNKHLGLLTLHVTSLEVGEDSMSLEGKMTKHTVSGLIQARGSVRDSRGHSASLASGA